MASRNFRKAELNTVCRKRKKKQIFFKKKKTIFSKGYIIMELPLPNAQDQQMSLANNKQP